MKFIVNTGALLKQLQLISGVVSSNSVLPILENFLFDVNKKNLTVFATDLETSMSSSMEIDSKDTGKIALPAKTLLEVLKNLPEQPLTFNIDDKTNSVEISSENGKYKMNGENGDDFPKIPIAENVTNLNIEAGVLGKAVAKTIFAVSNDELRPAMTGVYFQLDPDGTTFVATDAHKLVRYRRTDAKSDSASAFIVPKKALNLLKSALPSDSTAVNVSYNNSNAFFNFGNASLICRLIDARYPDYNAVIPTNNPNKLAIGRTELQSALRRIAIFSNKTTNQVVLKITGNELQVSAQDLDFSNEAKETLACTYEGNDMEIGFNAKFLVEMLNTLESDEITLELSTPNRAGVLFPS